MGVFNHPGNTLSGSRDIQGEIHSARFEDSEQLKVEADSFTGSKR